MGAQVVSETGAAPVSVADLARRHGVSRAHVLKLLRTPTRPRPSTGSRTSAPSPCRPGCWTGWNMGWR
uniref:Uncharacterized protein n=1 Tax=Phenylobacterium glaciei TaxID=2803784 RepID=A0A974P2B5_9CAUL|nr:hypothetical protein JKL49_25165 [Phenylobacterium glaciei]